mgnify:CR=1 FL=1
MCTKRYEFTRGYSNGCEVSRSVGMNSSVLPSRPAMRRLCTMSETQNNSRPAALDNRVVILNGFTNPEIIAIMNVVKAIYADTDLASYFEYTQKMLDSEKANEFAKRVLKVVAAAKQLPEAQSVATGDLIFAMSTENSLEMKLSDLIEDMSEDHEYLKNNPPGAQGSSANDPDTGSDSAGGQ